MATLPLHPSVVHVPLGLAFVLPLLAGGLAVGWWRRAVPRSAFALLVALQALLVAGALVAAQLGERDEKRVEPLVGKGAIEAHESRAEAFVWAGGVVLAGAIAVLVVPAGAVTAVAGAVAAGTLAVAALGVAVGEAGGELVYRRGGAAAYAAVGAARGGSAVPAEGRGERHGEND
jgi:hypothetical protein